MSVRPHSILHHPLRTLGTLLLATVPVACISDGTLPGVRMSSTPPGAHVLVDGTNSGHVTPCAVHLDPKTPHVVRFELAGYAPAERLLTPGDRRDLAYWRDADRWPSSFAFPLFLPFSDFWLPRRRDSSLQSPRMHVKLRLANAE